MKKKILISTFVVVAFFSLVTTPIIAIQKISTTELELTPEVSTPTTTDIFAPGVPELVQRGSEQVSVVIETSTSDYTQTSMFIEGLGGTITAEYTYINGFAATISAETLPALASDPSIVKIYEDSLQYLTASNDLIAPGGILMAETPGVEFKEVSIETMDPLTYANPSLTQADQIWADTNAGDGVEIAIIDTGCWSDPWVDPYLNVREPWYWDSVYDGIDLSYDVGTPFEGYGNPMNHYHGTACAALIAARVEIVFNPGHPWGNAMLAFDPGTWADEDGYIHTFCFGIAPYAEIYAVKVFDHTGGGVPSSIIMEGIEAAIDEEVDVISMSLGGGAGAPGLDPTDLLVDAATAAGITIVVSAGNEGPAPLRVGSPGTAKTAITVGAAMDPIHERVFAGLAFGNPAYGPYYYPSDELTIADFSSRGPTSDGRVKPDVVATGSWNFIGLTPQDFPYTISVVGGTSFSCPQVAGEVALLLAYIDNYALDLGPTEIKEAIMQGADSIDGFSAIEQGAGYINCVNSLEIIKTMEADDNDENCRKRGHRHHYPHFGKKGFPPIETLRLKHGKVTIEDISLEPGKYEYLAFQVKDQVDSIRITLSGVEFGIQNPIFGDAGIIYLSSAPREGIDDYFYQEYFFGDGIYFVASDYVFQPGLVRLVLAGDFSSFDTVTIDELTIEVVEVEASHHGKSLKIKNRGVDVDEAQVSLYDGTIDKSKGKVKEGEIDIYSFSLPDIDGSAIVELSWKLDWTKWATSDLDMIIFGPDGVNTDGVTGASPEVAVLTGAGDYEIWVEGYQVYFDKNEKYTLRIIYIADPVPLWDSEIFALDRGFKVRLPKKMKGLAVVWIHDLFFDHWYMGDYVAV